MSLVFQSPPKVELISTILFSGNKTIPHSSFIQGTSREEHQIESSHIEGIRKIQNQPNRLQQILLLLVWICYYKKIKWNNLWILVYDLRSTYNCFIGHMAVVYFPSCTLPSPFNSDTKTPESGFDKQFHFLLGD